MPGEYIILLESFNRKTRLINFKITLKQYFFTLIGRFLQTNYHVKNYHVVLKFDFKKSLLADSQKNINYFNDKNFRSSFDQDIISPPHIYHQSESTLFCPYIRLFFGDGNIKIEPFICLTLCLKLKT